MQMCPCGSKLSVEDCCLPIIRGERSAETVVAMMRSRYSAFVLGEIDWIIASHHPETVHEIDRADVEKWSRDSEWLGLQIEGSEQGEAEHEVGVVDFTARYRVQGTVHDHVEHAFFQRDGGEWRFHSVLEPVDEQIELVPVGPASTVGRNDPCPCGSGRKYKKCCA